VVKNGRSVGRGIRNDDEMPRLADRFHCLPPDLPEHGDSGRHPSLVERAVGDGAAIVPARVAPLMSAAVVLASPFLHRPLINRLMASALGVPPENRSAFRAGMRRVRPRTFSRAFHDAQNPGVLDEALRCEVPTLLIAGEHARGQHAANALSPP
jgi:pimeloyl-ACP methyl ester carboxylesterase